MNKIIDMVPALEARGRTPSTTAREIDPATRQRPLELKVRRLAELAMSEARNGNVQGVIVVLDLGQTGGIRHYILGSFESDKLLARGAAQHLLKTIARPASTG